MKCTEAHTFAIFVPGLSHILEQHTLGELFSLCDETVHGRITRILRLNSGAKLTLFDQYIVADVRIEEDSRKSYTCVLFALCEKRLPSISSLSITVMLPLLKRESFEQALYIMQTMAVTRVIPVITEKVHKNWWNTKSPVRMERVLIAAAEQSKQYALLVLEEPMSLSGVLVQQRDMGKSSGYAIVFDPDGQPVLDMIDHIVTAQPKNIVATFGPEGAYTTAERDALVNSGYHATALTRAVLRSQDAVTVGVGILRSLFV